MDGKERTTIVNDTIQMPLGLTLDLIREEVYFTDRHLNYIEVVSYNGDNRRKILANTHFLHGPTSLTLFENYLYWYDSNSNEVRRLNRFEHGVKAQKHERVFSRPGINHMKISHQIYQPLGKSDLLPFHKLILLLRNQSLPTISLYTIMSSITYSTCRLYMCLFDRFHSRTRSIYLFQRFVEHKTKYHHFSTMKFLFHLDYSPFVIYMRQNRIGGISVKHDQRYIDENSNYDDLWERFVTITDIHNGYEFAFDEANETIYWTQIKSFLPDGTAVVRNTPLSLFVSIKDQRCYLV